MDKIFKFFSGEGFMPHGHCYFWDPFILWAHAISDGLIALSYFIIPIGLFYIFQKRKDLEFSWVAILFGIFILSCGITHILDVVTIWDPVYKIDAVARIFTAFASVSTAIVLIKITPQIISIPTVAQWNNINESLKEQIALLEEKDQIIQAYNIELQHRLEQLYEAQELSQVGSFETDYVNRTFRGTPQLYKIFNWPDNLSETGASIDILYNMIHPEDIAMVKDIVGNAIQNLGSYSFQYRIILPDKTIKHILVRGKIVERGIIKSSIGTTMDITDRMHSESKMNALNMEIMNNYRELNSISEELTASNEELISSNEQLNEMREELEKLVAERTISLEKTLDELQERNEELDQYVYKLSHDIRAPIATIKGLIDLVKNESDQAQAETYLKLIENRIAKLDDFIHSVLNHSKNLYTQVQTQKIDFKDIIDQCFEELQYYPQINQIKLITNFNDGEDFEGDRLRLFLVFKNLISNSIKYRNPTVESYISIEIESNPLNAHITIKDNGIGIPQQYLDKIFQMFFRASEKSDGSGLGLYIVRQAVSRMGGKIDVRSVVGIGTVFTIQLPNLKLEENKNQVNNQ